MHIALINRSRHVTEDEAALMARFATVDLRHLASDWGMVAWSCAYYSSPSLAPPPAEATRCYLLDDPDASGAIGYHDVDPQGHPYIKAFVQPTLDNGGMVIPGGMSEMANSVLCTLTHETKEEANDAFCNGWVAMDGRTLTAMEMCDGCEDRAYPILLSDGHRSWVSDHLMPAWFRAGAQGPYTRGDRIRPRAAIAAPFAITSGGYRLDWAANGDPTQAFGARMCWGAHYPEWKKALKLHPRSRTARLAALAG